MSYYKVFIFFFGLLSALYSEDTSSTDETKTVISFNSKSEGYTQIGELEANQDASISTRTTYIRVTVSNETKLTKYIYGQFKELSYRKEIARKMPIFFIQ